MVDCRVHECETIGGCLSSAGFLRFPGYSCGNKVDCALNQGVQWGGSYILLLPHVVLCLRYASPVSTMPHILLQRHKLAYTLYLWVYTSPCPWVEYNSMDHQPWNMTYLFIELTPIIVVFTTRDHQEGFQLVLTWSGGLCLFYRPRISIPLRSALSTA